MSAFNCIGQKAATGIVSKHKGKAAQKRIGEIRDALVKQGESPALAQTMAEAQFEVELKGQTANQKWRLVNRVRVMKDLQAKLAANPNSKTLPVRMVDDTDFEARAIHKQIMGRVGEFLEKHRVTLRGQVSNPASFREFLKALHGEGTNDASAKALADAVNDANEWIRKKLNSYGYSIAKLDGWGMPHSHNRIAIFGAKFDGWSREIDGLLDWSRMTNPKTGLPFGAVPSDAYRREFLQEAFNNIAYGRASKNPTLGANVEGNVLERHRAFVFRDSDAWIKYNDKFGSSDPHSTLLSHWDQMSRHIALAKNFGRNPQDGLDYLGQLIAHRHRTGQSGAKETMVSEGSTAFAKRMMRVMEGGIGPSGYWGAQRARFFSTTRKLMTSAFLDRAVIISVPSDMNTATHTAGAIGMNPGNWFSTYIGLLKDGVSGGGTTRSDLLRAQHIAESWANPGVTMARFQAEYPAAAWAEKLSNASMRLQGLTAHTDSAKLAFSWGMSGQWASDAGKTFDQINPLMQKAMRDSGITPQMWDTFRSGPTFKASNGAEFLDPYFWPTAAQGDPAEIEAVALAFQTFQEKWTERAVPSRSLISQGFMDPNAYGLAPGDWSYEAIKSAGMFKSFLGAYVINQARMIGHIPTLGGKIGYTMSLVGTSTLVGAVAMQVGDLLLGRDPQDMTNENFWWRALLRGGGLGPVGDILATGSSSWGGGLQSYFTGPMVQLGQDVTEFTFGNAVMAYQQAMNGDEIDIGLMQQITDHMKRYMPLGQSPIMAGGAAMDRLIAEQMLLLVDPEAINDMAKKAQKRQNLYGGGYWWQPGSALPNRVPDLSTAAGP